MSHQLEMINGQAQMAFTGDRQAIWHKLGKQVPADLGPQEMMEAAGVNWEVEKIPLFASVAAGRRLEDGNPIDAARIDSGHCALVRSDNDRVLDVVTNSWNPVQNSEAFEFFNKFVETGDMQMDTAGSIRNGKMVWAMAKVRQGFTILGGDEVESYLLFSNPHQFGRCVDIKFTPVRVVCNNTLSYALSNVDEHQVRHSHRSVFDATRVKSVLGLAQEKLSAYKEKAEFLAGKRYNNEDLMEYFNRIFPVLTTKRESKKKLSKTATRAMEVVDTQPGAEFGRGSWWQALNAVTYITSNEYGRTDESRFDSVMYGANASCNIKALNLALEMAV